MRGKDEVRGSLFSYVDLEQRIRPDHPLRVVRTIVNASLVDMSVEFDALYPPTERDSISPERLLRALLLQAFYSIRSERQLVERIDFDPLFRWFVGLGVDDPVWDATTFTKNCDRLLDGEVAARFLATVLAQPQVRSQLSTEHFSMDGTLLEAWASTKSFRPKDGSGPPLDAGRNGEQDFRRVTPELRPKTPNRPKSTASQLPNRSREHTEVRAEHGLQPNEQAFQETASSSAHFGTGAAHATGRHASLLGPVLLATAWLLTAGPAVAAEVHVAPHGNDSNTGTATHPFASLEHARNAIREVRRLNPEQAMTIWLHGGRYPRKRSFELETEDSGSAQAPLIIAARPGEQPLLSGMTRIPKADFQPVVDREVLDRIIDPAAQRRLLQIDLSAAGIEELGTFGRRGFRIPNHLAAPAPVHLHHGGRRLPVARWPNPDESFAALLSRFHRTRRGVVARSGVVDPGPVLEDGASFWSRGGTISVAFNRLAHWGRAEEIWLDGVFGASWEWSYNRVLAIDPAQHRITLATGEVNSIRAEWSGDFFFAENLLEEIDRPGEWFLDRARRLLYLLPPPSWDEAEIWAELSVLAVPMIRIRNASHIVVRGLVFDGGRSNAIVVEGGEGVRVEQSEIRNFALDGISMTGARHGVSASWLHNIGGTAVSLTCGNIETLERGECFVEDSRIHDWGWYQKIYTGAVNIFGVGQQILHNRLHNGAHGAIFVHGNDHLIEGNRIHNVVENFVDMGAIYSNTGAQPLQRGHIVRRNYFHDIGQFSVGQSAIYIDNMSRGWVIEENIFERIGGSHIYSISESHAVKLNAASYILVRHNMFVNCLLPMSLGSHAARAFLPSFRQAWERDLRPERLATLPHLLRYPELDRFWSEDHSRPAEVRFEENVVWNSNVQRRGSVAGRTEQEVVEVTLDQLGTLRTSRNWIISEGENNPGRRGTSAAADHRPPVIEIRDHIPDFPDIDLAWFGPRP